MQSLMSRGDWNGPHLNPGWQEAGGPLTVWTVVPWSPVICASVDLLGSFAHGTTRTWTGPGTTMGWEEGAARWAAWTFLYGLAALAFLVAAVFMPRYLAPLLAVSAAVPFALAAYLGRKNWLRLLEERDRPRDYELSISAGLPIVTVAAAAGVVCAAILAAAWCWRIASGREA